MKVYVENGDIPKRCIECRFCYYSEDEYCHCCKINGIDIENKKCWRETHPDCPLQSLADYTKQVRKEVCEYIGKNVAVDIINFNVYVKYDDLTKILEQIEKGETEWE